MKLRKPFTMSYPLRHKIVRDLRIVTETVGELIVEGTAYLDTSASVIDIFDRYGVDIALVTWNGSDIKPVLEITGAMDEIEEAAIKHSCDLFNSVAV
jgi:hypothetical protein